MMPDPCRQPALTAADLDICIAVSCLLARWRRQARTREEAGLDRLLKDVQNFQQR